VRPALSVVLFTVLAGAGLGMLVVVAFMDVASIVLGQAGAAARPRAAVVGLALLVAGLLSSTLHLGNPRNAWRSLSRVRTSWLSREAAVALMLLPVATLWIALLQFDAMRGTRALLALITIVLAWATLYCTAMIYASLKPIRQWHTPRVPLGYALIAHFSGAVLVLATLRAYGEAPPALAVIGALLLVGTVVAKVDYYRYIGSDRGRLTIEDAIGVAHGVGPRVAAPTMMRARLLDVGHSRGTFLTHEFVYTLTRLQRVALRLLFWCAGIAAPALWLAFGIDHWHGAALVALACLGGIIAERWLFFAEARHTVRLYHGDRST
jgi:sulfite dehydrogenase (quinone) subunit SoeC